MASLAGKNPMIKLYLLILGEGVKAYANGKLFTKIIKSYNISKNKYVEQYDMLNDYDKEDFKWATILIKNHYHPKIGQTHKVLTSTKKIEEDYCDDVDSLDKQYTMIKSKKYKYTGDFLRVFQQNLTGEGKFQKLSTTISSDMLQAQAEIEALFMDGTDNLSYMIPYIIHDIYNNAYYIDKEVMYEEVIKKINNQKVREDGSKHVYKHTKPCSIMSSIMSKIFSGGSYSKRRAPKKRTLTIKKVKVIK